MKESIRQKDERLNVQVAEADKRMKVLELKVDSLTIYAAAKDK